MPWNIENYYIMNNTVLQVEITIPLMEFLYVNIDEVKDAWVDLLGGFVAEHPDYEMSWEMAPQDEDALILVRIAKAGDLKEFTSEEAKDALAAADALFDAEKSKPKKKGSKKTAKAKPKSKAKASKKKKA